MSIIDRVSDFTFSPEKVDQAYPDGTGFGGAVKFDSEYFEKHGPFDVLDYFQKYLFIQHATAYRCTTLISSAISSCDLRAYRKDTFEIETNQTNKAGAFNQMINRHINGDTPKQFIEDICTDMSTSGNFFSIPVWIRGRISDAYLLEPFGVSVRRVDGRKAYSVGQNRNDPNVKPSYTAKDVIHGRLPALGSNRDIGTPPVRLGSPDMRIALASEERVAKLLEKGNLNKVAGIFHENATPVSGAKMVKIKNLMEQYPSELPLLLPDIASFVNLTADPQNANWAQMRRMAQEDIARRYGVPSPLLNLESTSVGSGVENLSRIFLRYGLRPYMSRIEDIFTISFVDPRTHFIKFDDRHLMRGDYDTITKIVKTAVGNNPEPFITKNEARTDLGYSKLADGGEDLIGSTGIQAIQTGDNSNDEPDD